MKKFSKLFFIIFIIGFVFIFSACSNMNMNLLKNSYFIDRADTEKILPSDWTIYSPDMENLEIRSYPSDNQNAGLDDNSNLRVTISNKHSYVYVVQKVKLKKNTIYCLSYKAQLRRFTFPDEADVKGVHPVILEDKDMYNAPDYKITEIISNNSSWRTKPYEFYFNSNNNTELTIGLSLGSEDALCNGAMYLSGVKLNSTGRGVIAESSVHNVVKNSGYKISGTGEILFAVLISIAFVGIFLTGVWLLCITYNKRKIKKNKNAEFDIPSEDELLNDQKILTEPVDTAKPTADITDEPVKFDKNKLDALFSEDADNTQEIISDITNDLLNQSKPMLAIVNPPQTEVETIAVGKKIRRFKLTAGWVLLITMLAALAVRIVLAALIRGFRADLNLFINYINSIEKNGITEFYNRNDTFFSAGGVYILSCVNMFMGLFNVNIMSPGGAFLIKLPAIIADLLTALVIYKAASKYINKNFAVVMAGLYMFNPAVFMNSAVWGAIDSVYTLLIVLTFYMLVEKKTLLCFLCYTFAVLIKVNALSVAPVLIIYYGYRFVSSVIYMIRHRAAGFKQNIKGEGTAVWRLPVYTLGAFVLFYLLAMPAAFSEIQGDFFFPISHLIFWAAGDLTYYSNNAFNFFSLLGRNGAELGDKFPTELLTALFVVIVTAIVAIIYIARHNRANVVMLASYSVFALTFFLTDMKPVYTLPAIALLLFAVCLNKDRRLLLVYGMLSVVSFLNQAIVMIFSHNLNNLPDYMLDSAHNPLYNGTNFIDGEAGLIINIIFGIIMFAIFAYYTYLTLEIGLGNRRRKIIPLEYNKKTFFKAFKSIIR